MINLSLMSKIGLHRNHHVSIFFITLVVVFFWLIQSPISLQNGHPLDAGEYFTMAEQVAAGEPISALQPHNYRIGLPFLVGKIFPNDIAFGYKFLNFLFTIAMTVAFALYLRSCQLGMNTILLLLLALVCASQSPYRFLHFIPSYVDPPALFFIVLLLYLGRSISQLDLRWSLIVTALSVIGVLFREISLCGLLVFVFVQCVRIQQRPPFLTVLSWKNITLCFMPLISSIITLFLVHVMIEGTREFEYLEQMRGVFSSYVAQPAILFLAFLTSFGVIPLVLLVASRHLKDFLSENQDVMVYLIGSLMLVLFGGFHTDRIAFWSFPAVLLLFGVLLEKHPIRYAPITYKLAFYVPLFAAQALAWRVWLPIPDATHLAELSDPGSPPGLLLLSAFGDVKLGHFYAGSLPAHARLTLLWQFVLSATYFGTVLKLADSRHSRTKRLNSACDA